MKKGFTLLELLVVIVVVSVVSVSSIIVFGNIDDDSNVDKRVNLYKDIQRGAILYLDLNDEWLEQFNENKEVYINISELKNTNYVSSKLEDPVTKKELSGNMVVKIYVGLDSYGKEYLNSCILQPVKNGSEVTNKCIANSDGLEKDCCE